MCLAQFDLRLYALVPSFAPLEIYLFRGGFARFTNSRYSNNPSDIANSFIHLTNVAIQKTSEHYNKKVRPLLSWWLDGWRLRLVVYSA